MMKCSQYQEKFWDYYDGTLTAEEAAELEKHLESCPECAAEAKMVKQMLESLHTLPEAALPEGYHEELMGKIAKENLAKVSDASIDQTEKQETGKVVPFPQKRRKNWKNFGLVAAAVVLVAAAGGIQGIQQLRAPPSFRRQKIHRRHPVMEQKKQSQQTTVRLTKQQKHCRMQWWKKLQALYPQNPNRRQFSRKSLRRHQKQQPQQKRQNRQTANRKHLYRVCRKKQPRQNLQQISHRQRQQSSLWWEHIP